MLHFQYYHYDPQQGRFVPMGSSSSEIPPEIARMLGLDNNANQQMGPTLSGDFQSPLGISPEGNFLFMDNATPSGPASSPEPHTDTDYMRREVAALDITPVLRASLMETIDAYEYLVYGGDDEV